MSSLYIVSTPIGNLEDITLRALRVLKEVDLIIAEDTRVTAKLLSRYEIKKPLKRYDEHVHGKAVKEIAGLLLAGKNIALVTDAGTPGISDPAARLVSYVMSDVRSDVRCQSSDVRIVPIPGPSALTAALSVSGIPADGFTFLGYPPHKKGRKKFFESIKNAACAELSRSIVLFESPHRLQKTLGDLKTVLGETAVVFIAKEITKIHEDYFTGAVGEAANYFSGRKGKGEFVIIIPLKWQNAHLI